MHHARRVDGGRFVAKRCVGDRLAVEADIFGEGHDLLAACVHWRMAGEEEWLRRADAAAGQ
jgi:starch synthase (maltosyl-transferring)